MYIVVDKLVPLNMTDCVYLTPFFINYCTVLNNSRQRKWKQNICRIIALNLRKKLLAIFLDFMYTAYSRCWSQSFYFYGC